MRILSFILIFSFSITAYSKTEIKDVNIVYTDFKTIINQDIGSEQTCLDEFLLREKQLRRFLIWAPPATLVATPMAVFIGGYGAGVLANTIGAGGWAALGYALAGAGLGGVGVIGTFIGLETAKAIEFSNNRFMINLIVSLNNNETTKHTKKFIKTYRKKYPQDSHKSDEDIYHSIVDLDKDGSLCNGIVTGNENKFKKKLARKRHLLRYIHTL